MATAAPPSGRKRLGCLRTVFILVAALALLIVLLYLEEDWRGANELAAAKARGQTAGYSLNPADYYPPPVSDDQNLAALPVFQLEPDSDNPKRMLATRLFDATDEDKHGGTLYDYYRKKDLPMLVAEAYAKLFPGKTPPASSLAQLEALYPIIGDLRGAAPSRPDFRLNIDYGSYPVWERPLGLVVYETRVAKLLADHAQLALRENQPQVAQEDIAIGFRIARGVGNVPSLVGGLVSRGVSAVTRRNIDEGLDKHAWNDAQLVAIQDELRKTGCLVLFPFDMRGEAVTFTLPFYAALKADPSVVALTFPTLGLIGGWDREEGGTPRGNSTAGFLLWSVFARGWWDMNAARMIDLEYHEGGTVDVKNRRVDAKLTQRIEDEVLSGRVLPGGLAPWKMFYNVGAGAMTSGVKQFARGQVELDEDRIVCGLERYRLTHGGYPMMLDALAPTYIDEVPHDIMNGEPYHYRLNADGTFLLYSVGWNQTDDGGKVAYSQYSPNIIDYNQGDWVWPMVKK